jgi:hypothetical protein
LLEAGATVRHSKCPAWGTGVVTHQYGGYVYLFFVGGGTKKLAESMAHLERAIPSEAESDVLQAAARETAWDRASFHIYVIRLTDEVRRERLFVAANPTMRQTLPCVYVGLTGLTPEERWANHKRGHKSAKYPHKYGTGLMPELYSGINPLPRGVAEQYERYLTMKLRAEGYGAWSN